MSEAHRRNGSTGTTGARRGEPIFVCGLGAVTGYGWGSKLLWDGLLTGESAVVPQPDYAEYMGLEQAWLALVPDGGDPEDGPTRFARALRFSAREAMEDARSRGWGPGRVVGVVHSLVMGDVELSRDFHLSEGRHGGPRKWLQLMPSTSWSMLMKEHELHGPSMSVTAMCSSGNAGLLTAKMWIDAGIATDVLLVATDISGAPETMKLFSDLGVMVMDRPPMDACRPFQEGSRGFTGGEASVAMVLSSRPDGAYATVLGGAMTNDGHHAISIAADHRQIFRCFEEALQASGVEREMVTYMNAHGTGTRQCDRAESHVLNDLLSGCRGVFSIKPLVGHCQAAASALELLASFYGYEKGVIPAPPQIAPGHPLLLDGVTPVKPGTVVKSAIGMGGHNAVVVLDPPP